MAWGPGRRLGGGGRAAVLWALAACGLTPDAARAAGAGDLASAAAVRSPPPVTGHVEVMGSLGAAYERFGVPEPAEDVAAPLGPESGAITWSIDFRWFDSSGHGVSIRGGAADQPPLFGGYTYDVFFVEPSYAYRLSTGRTDGWHLVLEAAAGLSLAFARMTWSSERCLVFCSGDDEPAAPAAAPSSYDHVGMGIVVHVAVDVRFHILSAGIHGAYRIAVPFVDVPVDYDSSVDVGFRFGFAFDLTGARPAEDLGEIDLRRTSPGEADDPRDPLAP